MVDADEKEEDDADSDDDLFMKTKDNVKRKVKVPEKISANQVHSNAILMICRSMVAFRLFIIIC